MDAPRRLSIAEDYAELLDRYDTWLFDCDGVLWRVDNLIDGVLDVLELLRSMDKKILFVTNNATLSRKSYKTKLDRLGIPAHVDEIFGSAYAAAVYLSSVIKFSKEKKVYLIGMEGLEEELRNEGISYAGGTDPIDNTLDPFSPSSYSPDPSIGAVLCGFDSSITYTKIAKAFMHLNRTLTLNQSCDRECLFLATNADATYPAQGDLVLPGGGAVFAPLCTALSSCDGKSREPLIIGKPSGVMLDCIKAKHTFDPARTIMVGDRLNTDILFGKQGGLATLLVLTGVTQERDLTGSSPLPAIPDFLTNGLGDFRIVNKM